LFFLVLSGSWDRDRRRNGRGLLSQPEGLGAVEELVDSGAQR